MPSSLFELLNDALRVAPDMDQPAGSESARNAIATILKSTPPLPRRPGRFFAVTSHHAAATSEDPADHADGAHAVDVVRAAIQRRIKTKREDHGEDCALALYLVDRAIQAIGAARAARELLTKDLLATVVHELNCVRFTHTSHLPAHKRRWYAQLVQSLSRWRHATRSPAVTAVWTHVAEQPDVARHLDELLTANVDPFPVKPPPAMPVARHAYAIDATHPPPHPPETTAEFADAPSAPLAVGVPVDADTFVDAFADAVQQSHASEDGGVALGIPTTATVPNTGGTASMTDGFVILAKRAPELAAASSLVMDLFEGGVRDGETITLVQDLRAGLAEGVPLLSRAAEAIADMGDAPNGVPSHADVGDGSSVPLATLGDVLALHDRVAEALARCDAMVGQPSIRPRAVAGGAAERSRTLATQQTPSSPSRRALSVVASQDFQIVDVEEANALLEKHRLACVEAAWAGHGDAYVEVPAPVAANMDADALENELLLVLDVDHTLGEFVVNSASGDLTLHPRPHVDAFLTSCAKMGCCLVLWSHTKELGMLRRKVEVLASTLKRAGAAEPSWKLELVAGRGLSLFIPARGPGAAQHVMAHAKPLAVLWDHPRFSGRFGLHNTLHVDDTPSNFVFNQSNGISVRRFHHDDGNAAKDDDLALLTRYIRLVISSVAAGSRGAHEWEHVAWRRELLMAEAEEKLRTAGLS